MFKWLSNLVQKRSENPIGDIFIGGYNTPIPTQPTSAGVMINVNRILSIPSFRRCMLTISGLIAQCDLSVYRYLADGSSVEDYDHLSWHFLNRRPTEAMTCFIWKQTIIHDLLIHGNSYFFLRRDEYAGVLEIFHLDPLATRIDPSAATLMYETYRNGRVFQFAPADILHFQYLSDGLQGYSVMQQVASTFGLRIALTEHANQLFKNNAMPKCFLNVPGSLDKEEAAKILDGFNLNYRGLDNAGKTAILANGITMTPVIGSNETQQYAAINEQTDRTIACLCGVPCRFIGLPDSVSYNSLEQDYRSFTLSTLAPLMKMIEEELEAKLLTENEKKRDSRYIEFDRSNLTKTDTKTEMELDINLVNNGLMTEQEFGLKHNRPVTGSNSTRRRIPSNITFQDLLDIPEPVAPDPAIAADPEQAVDLAEGDSDDTRASRQLQELVQVDAARQLTRVKKAIQANQGRADFTNWLDAELPKHEEVFTRSFAPLHRDDKIAQWFTELKEELTQVTREQIPTVLESRTVDKLSEVLL